MKLRMQKPLKLFNIKILAMKYLITLLSLLLSITCFGQDPPANTMGEWQWSRNYATSWNKYYSEDRNANTIRYVHEDSLGGVIIFVGPLHIQR